MLHTTASFTDIIYHTISGSVGDMVPAPAARREFLFLGEPVKQVADAIECASLGELAASSFAIQCLESADGCICNVETGAGGGPRVIARRSEKFFDLVQKEGRHCTPSKSSVTWQPENTDLLSKQMELYVHPSALQDSYKSGKTKRRGSDQVLASAELRRVFTMFVKPEVDPVLTFDKEKDGALFALLNDIMNITQSILKRFKGHLRQFIVDDKGVVLILSWGEFKHCQHPLFG